MAQQAGSTKHRTNKPVLVEALRHMPTICPPRLAQQAKTDLQRLVNRALWRPDGDPVRLAMEQALRDARAHCHAHSGGEH